MTDRPEIDLEHYSHINQQAIFRTEQISKAFELYMKLFTALVAATGGVALAEGQVTPETKAFLYLLIGSLTAFLGYSSIKIIKSHRKIWEGFREDQVTFGPIKNGKPVVPREDKSKDINTHSFQVMAVGVSAALLAAVCFIFVFLQLRHLLH